MHEPFVALGEFLRPPVRHEPCDPVPAEPEAPLPPEIGETLAAARRFRAALSDALDVAIPNLLEAIAREVLARELRIDGADIAGIVESALSRYASTQVLRVRVHPADRAALHGLEIACVGDERLRRGDLQLELQSGTIDLSVELRLEHALRTWPS